MTIENQDSLDRQKAREAFIADQKWQDAQITPLKADASFRRYYRLTRADESVLVMDAPPTTEDVKPFIEVGEHLKRLGFSAPEILAKDIDNGFLLLEDFGDSTFTNLLKDAADDETETTLYKAATECLVALHNSPENADIRVPAYSLSVLIREADLFIDWYYPECIGQDIGEEARENFHQAWEACY
ncbi:MAG: phosphotransferase, partial [Alphaproteobacteria bacterium]|nr:phosphotransferase [Alphaproteobacteria bacterium]